MKKKFIISLIAFILLFSAIITHSFMMLHFGEKAAVLTNKLQASALEKDWIQVRKKLDELDNLWQKQRKLAALTIRTSSVEEIDICLEQSKIHAKTETLSDFLDEFIMLKNLLKHLPHQEGFHIEEIF